MTLLLLVWHTDPLTLNRLKGAVERMVQSFLKVDNWRNFSKTTTAAENKWFVARLVTKNLISNKIKVFALEIKIMQFTFSCYLDCSFCQQYKDLFVRYVIFVFLNACISTYKAAVWKQWFAWVGTVSSSWRSFGSHRRSKLC